MICTHPLVRAALVLSAASIIVSLSGCLGGARDQTPARAPSPPTAHVADEPEAQPSASSALDFEAGTQLDPAVPLTLDLNLSPDWLIFHEAGQPLSAYSASGCTILVTEHQVQDAASAAPVGDERASVQLLEQTIPALSGSIAVSEQQSVAEVQWRGGTASFLRYEAHRLDNSHTVVTARVFETLALEVVVVAECPGEAPAALATLDGALIGLELRAADTIGATG